MSNQKNEVREFYNQFAYDVLLEDLKLPNRRQLEVIKLCKNFVHKKSRVLEIGCGIGIITKALASSVGEIKGLDISDKNIQIASKISSAKNISFYCINIIEDNLESLKNYDFVILADVIEHIPLDRHEELFEKIWDVTNENASVILTYPSPEYQVFLREKNPSALQIIDEVIQVNSILSSSQMNLRYFSYKSVFGNLNNYCHLVLTKTTKFVKKGKKYSFFNKIQFKLQSMTWRVQNLLAYRKLKNLRSRQA